MRYVRVMEWSAERDGIRFEMLGEDDAIHRFEVSAECAGVLVAALALEAGKLNLEGRDQQFVRPTAIQTARTEQDEPVILLTINGGVDLPLVFKQESLTRLIAELEGLRGAIQPGAQIRWN